VDQEQEEAGHLAGFVDACWNRGNGMKWESKFHYRFAGQHILWERSPFFSAPLFPHKSDPNLSLANLFSTYFLVMIPLCLAGTSCYKT